MAKTRFDDDPDKRPRRRRRRPAASREGAAIDPVLIRPDARDGLLTPRQRATATRNHVLERVVKRRLEAAGHRVEFHDDDLYVDEVPVGTDTRLKLARHRERADWARDDAAFARLVEALLPDILVRQARHHARAWDAAAVLEPAEHGHGYTIRRRGGAVAHVSAANFVTADGRHHNGPFWTAGKHWQDALRMLPAGVARPQTASAPPPLQAAPAERTARAIPHPPARRAKPAIAAPQRRNDPEPNRWESWPADASPELTAIAVAASAPLRNERVRVDEIAVVSDCGDGHIIRFEPLRRRKRSGVLELPYELRSPPGAMRGHVYLGSPAMPMAIHVSHRDMAVPLADAWARVLEVACARYCADPDLSPHENPGGFIPDGPTRELRKHWVSAHRMRLPDGRRASVDAIKAAETFDIELPDGFTWRSGHLRGLAESDTKPVLRYTWHRPAADRDAA